MGEELTSRGERRAFFGSISSDIAAHLAGHLIEQGWVVEGTFRTASPATDRLVTAGAILRPLDFASASDIRALLDDPAVARDWDLLMMSPATQEPIGLFGDCDWDQWEASFGLNSIRQFQLLHGLLPRRRQGSAPLVFQWTGPGTNSASPRFSALAAAKTAQVKMCELLAVEYPDTRFIIVGPGWVSTKTHLQTLSNPAAAGDNYERTAARLASGQTTSLEEIAGFLDWALTRPGAEISGRNFSIRGDLWGSPELDAHLAADPHALKLRRASNDWRPGVDAVSYDPPAYPT